MPLASGATLVLGIGIAAAAWAVIDAVILSPFPFARQRELAVVWKTAQARHQPFVELSYLDYEVLRQRASLVQQVAVMPSVGGEVVWRGPSAPVRIRSRAVSTTFFDTLGVRPERGRTFVASDAEPGSPAVALLSHRMWRQTGGDASVSGAALRLGDTFVTVIGVMPPAFDFPTGTDVWLPIVPNGTAAFTDPAIGWRWVSAGCAAPPLMLRSLTRSRGW